MLDVSFSDDIVIASISDNESLNTEPVPVEEEIFFCLEIEEAEPIIRLSCEFLLGGFAFATLAILFTYGVFKAFSLIHIRN